MIQDPMDRRPMALLDRDGVLNRDTGYPHRPDQIEWTEGAFQALARLKAGGYRVVVATNQSGVARGYFTETDVLKLHQWMAAEVAAHHGAIDAFFYCPYHPDAAIAAYRKDHPDRKPAPGLLLRALAEFPTDVEHSFLIGDQARDMAAAKAAGIRGWLFEGGNLDAFVGSVLASA